MKKVKEVANLPRAC